MLSCDGLKRYPKKIYGSPSQLQNVTSFGNRVFISAIMLK